MKVGVGEIAPPRMGGSATSPSRKPRMYESATASLWKPQMDGCTAGSPRMGESATMQSWKPRMVECTTGTLQIGASATALSRKPGMDGCTTAPSWKLSMDGCTSAPLRKPRMDVVGVAEVNVMVLLLGLCHGLDRAGKMSGVCCLRSENLCNEKGKAACPHQSQTVILEAVGKHQLPPMILQAVSHS